MKAPAPKILVVDDDESMREGCVQTLREEGYKAVAAESGNRGLQMSKKESFDVIILDLRMPGLHGLEVLKKLRESDPEIIVIVITGYATIDSAVEAMKRGAYDFLPKPFSPEARVEIVKRAWEKRQLALENVCLRLELDGRMGGNVIIGKSPAMAKVAELVKKVGPTDSTVLISGETGVGKELVANAIHRASERRDKPFVVVDCGALVETLFESELFGHVKGAFTGAIETKHGKFELANGGTIFLDEIANVGANIQAKLLRVIQEREVTKVGSSQKIDVDVRIIAATNKDLQNEIKEGNFREDLFYRLNVVPVHLPSLRERKEDIPMLVQHFLKKLAEKRRRAGLRISDRAMNLLESYDWPGNVRELENTIERAAVVAEGDTIQPEDLLYQGFEETDEVGEAENGSTVGRLAAVEKEEIEKALRQFGWQKGKAAEYLGINRKTLREKLRRYGIGDDT
jgi:DNA-binding NtrC family response regulator